MIRERPWIGGVVEHFLTNWWWAWFFRESYESLDTKPTLIELLERPYLGDLREFEKNDHDRKIPEKIDVPKSEVLEILRGEKKNDAEKLEDVALVTTEEDAEIFSTNKLRNLFKGDPIEYIPSKLGRISCTVEVPVTKREVIVVVASVDVPVTERFPAVVIFPPTF
jgi:hypothetical protein